MLSKSLFALLIIPGIALIAFQSKEVKPMGALEFDRMYQQAFHSVIKTSGIFRATCAIHQSERDYRYLSCFVDKTNGKDATLRHTYDVLKAAGFVSLRPVGNGGENVLAFGIKGQPYTINITYQDSGMDWITYVSNHTGGYAPPRPGHDQNASYALIDAVDAAKDISYQIIGGTGFQKPSHNDWVHPCGPATETEAAICIKADWTRAEAQKALVDRYFNDHMEWFMPLDKKPTFEYREEQRIARSIERGILNKGDTSDLLIKKLNQTTYLMRHKSDWPAYEFVFTIPAIGQKGDFKVLARRITAPPYKI